MFICCCFVYVTGENVDLLFIRSAALAFDQAILREYEEIEKMSKRYVMVDVISKNKQLNVVGFIILSAFLDFIKTLTSCV